MVVMLGMLCGCGAEQINNPEETQGSAAVQRPEDDVTALTDYVTEGASIEDADAEDIDEIVPFEVNGRFAIADESGEPITDAIYDRVECLEAGDETYWALYDENGVTCVDSQGAVIASGEGQTAELMDEQYIVLHGEDETGESSVYSLNGVLLAESKGLATSCSDGVMVSRREGKKRSRWYITDLETGERTRVKKVREIGEFSGGYATVHIAKRRWGIIDSEGSVTELLNIVKMQGFHQGYTIAKNADGLYGVINASGKAVIPFEYTDGSVCNEEQAIFQLWAEDGTSIIRNVRTDQKVGVPGSYDGEELVSWPDHYYSYTDDDGELILFDDLMKIELGTDTELYEWSEEALIAQSSEGVSVIDLSRGSQSKELDAEYADSSDFDAQSEDYFTVQDSATGKQGICSRTGKLVLDMEYDWIRPTTGGYFAAEQDGYSGLIDEDGAWVLKIHDAEG